MDVGVYRWVWVHGWVQPCVDINVGVSISGSQYIGVIVSFIGVVVTEYMNKKTVCQKVGMSVSGCVCVHGCGYINVLVECQWLWIVVSVSVCGKYMHSHKITLGN